MTAYLTSRFGVRPRGMWLAERVWEPHLAKPIAEAGVEYVILDDNHFKAAGLPDRALTGYFLTEEQGVSLALFPISQRLRYLIPFQEPADTLAYLRERASLAPGGIAVMADDAEKFGGWPGTHDWVYGRGWLKRFLQTLQEHAGWVRLTTFGQALTDPPQGRIYLPTTSYTEMTEWALPAEAAIAFEEARALVDSLPAAAAPPALSPRGVLAQLPHEVPRGQHAAQEDAAGQPTRARTPATEPPPGGRARGPVAGPVQ
jgi:hypothetical protein